MEEDLIIWCKGAEQLITEEATHRNITEEKSKSAISGKGKLEGHTNIHENA